MRGDEDIPYSLFFFFFPLEQALELTTPKKETNKRKMNMSKEKDLTTRRR